MMMKYRVGVYTSVLLSVIGCGSSDKPAISQTIEVLDMPYVSHLNVPKKTHLDLTLDNTPKDIYLLLTNGTNQVKNINSIGRGNKVINISSIDTNISTSHRLLLRHVPAFIDAFNKQIPTLLQHHNKTTSTIHTSISDQNAADNASASIKYSTPVQTSFGTKTLKIWVSNDSFGSGCNKSKCVTQEMVNALGQAFLKEGTDNDIYDWVTNIYGEEWGAHQEDEMIADRDDITIFLTDIDRDNSTSGGVIGYFYAKNNFLSTRMPGSNERLMFYVDSVLFANGTNGWNIDDFWPKETLSTLAHEFTHMIHFYQKTILRTRISTDTWIEEMLAESTEDLLASKIRYIGGRGVDYRRGDAGDRGNTKGRYPRFNANNSVSLNTWNNQLIDYSKVNAFGAYLLRNYGGAKVLHDIMHNDYVDQESITSVTHQTLPTLLTQWGTAVLLSDEDNLVDLPTYNRGDYWSIAYNQSVYDMGSVNFFNYSPQPNLSSSMKHVEPSGNKYIQIAKGVSGAFSFEIDVDNEIEATLIIKESNNAR